MYGKVIADCAEMKYDRKRRDAFARQALGSEQTRSDLSRPRGRQGTPCEPNRRLGPRSGGRYRRTRIKEGFFTLRP